MTIRQEIKEILDTVCDDIEETDDHSTDLEKHTYEILKLFTKLIDSKIQVLEKQRKDIEKTHSDDLQCNGITGQHLMIVGSVVELSKLKEELKKQ